MTEEVPPPPRRVATRAAGPGERDDRPDIIIIRAMTGRSPPSPDPSVTQRCARCVLTISGHYERPGAAHSLPLHTVVRRWDLRAAPATPVCWCNRQVRRHSPRTVSAGSGGEGERRIL
jgi:hypothetical protein